MKTQELCPCQSTLSYGQCCEPLLTGKQKPKTAEQLLRARFSAFATANIDYILATHHQKTSDSLDRDEITNWAKGSAWHGIQVVQKEAGEEKDTQGTIIFCAKYAELTGEKKGEIQEHWEKSFFEREPASPSGEWKFLDAQGVHVGTYKRTEPKTGRNDPCPCGSGKKFKKCHAVGESAQA